METGFFLSVICSQFTVHWCVFIFNIKFPPGMLFFHGIYATLEKPLKFPEGVCDIFQLFN